MVVRKINWPGLFWETLILAKIQKQIHRNKINFMPRNKKRPSPIADATFCGSERWCFSWSKAPLPHDLRRPLLCIGRVDADNWENTNTNTSKRPTLKIESMHLSCRCCYYHVDAAITRLSMVMMRHSTSFPSTSSTLFDATTSLLFQLCWEESRPLPWLWKKAFLCLEHYVCFCDPDRREDDCRDICAVCECQEGVWYNNPRNQASLAHQRDPLLVKKLALFNVSEVDVSQKLS